LRFLPVSAALPVGFAEGDNCDGLRIVIRAGARPRSGAEAGQQCMKPQESAMRIIAWEMPGPAIGTPGQRAA
jgi:hypothetical protein